MRTLFAFTLALTLALVQSAAAMGYDPIIIVIP